MLLAFAGCTDATPAPLPVAYGPLAFATQSASLPSRAYGVSLGDLDRDGDLDLAIATEDGPVRLFRNRGDAQFDDVTASFGFPSRDPGPLTRERPASVDFVDLDGDGWLDLVVTESLAHPTFWRSREGTGFEPIPLAGQDDVIAGCAAFFDIDADGDLDVFIGTNAIVGSDFEGGRGAFTGDNGAPDVVLRNDGGVFVDVSVESGLAGSSTGETTAALAFDADGDLDLDLFVAQDRRPDELHVNVGGGRFETRSGFMTEGQTGIMGLDIADIDLDGRVDLYASDWGWGRTLLWTEVSAGPSAGEALRFPDMTAALFGDAPVPWAGLTGWGVALSDVDLDGDVDLVGTSSYDVYGGLSRPGRLTVVENLGLGRAAGTFVDRSNAVGDIAAETFNGFGLAAGDLDGDLAPDLVLGVRDRAQEADTLPPEKRPPPESVTSSIIVMNRGTKRLENHGFAIEIDDTTSKNRWGVGALVQVRVGTRTQSRVVTAGGSYLGGSGLRLHFGLGPAARADEVVVIFPDGISARAANVPAGFLRITR